MSDDFTFKFSEAPKVIIKIGSDGSVHVTDGHTLDDAAQAFWRTVEIAGPKKEIERLTAELAAAREIGKKWYADIQRLESELAAERKRANDMEARLDRAVAIFNAEVAKNAKLCEALEPFAADEYEADWIQRDGYREDGNVLRARDILEKVKPPLT